ncbi:hypothetical protein [Chryseobacterium terrae]|uniref:Uncharacterized protein n=1 Tax=Chryseobacterium terrae TaxID=3163299 RepID=A0ABW8Y699_9FLAO
MKIYWTSVEFTYKKSTEKLKGGFVYAFTKAIDARDALDLFLTEFEKKDLQIIFVEYVSLYDLEMEWETKKQTNHFRVLYKEAVKYQGVILDDFYSYEDD